MGKYVSVLALAVMTVGLTATTALAGVTAVPEPTSLALLASGMGVFYVARKLRAGK